MRLFVMVQGVKSSSPARLASAWNTGPNHSQLKVRRCTETENHELLAKAWQAANAKARELGWIA
jgi:hypothetical protein